MNTKGKIALFIGALIAFITAIAHLSCIFLGAECFEAQLAPPEMIESAKAGTWLAPVLTIVASSLFILCGLFALSAAGIIKKIPLTFFALPVIAILCTIRGLATIPLSFAFPEMVSTYSLLSGFIWFLVGVLYAFGFIHYRNNKK